MMRPTQDQYLMELAKVAATRATCLKRAVGCVLADEKGRVLSIGYNGVASGQPHCNEPRFNEAHKAKEFPHSCVGYDLPSGQDSCEAVHAEHNAILQCKDADKIYTAYVTLSPCKPCIKLLMNTGCQRIVFREEHTDPWPREQWLKLGREWLLLW